MGRPVPRISYIYTYLRLYKKRTRHKVYIGARPYAFKMQKNNPKSELVCPNCETRNQVYSTKIISYPKDPLYEKYDHICWKCDYLF